VERIDEPLASDLRIGASSEGKSGEFTSLDFVFPSISKLQNAEHSVQNRSPIYPQN